MINDTQRGAMVHAAHVAAELAGTHDNAARANIIGREAMKYSNNHGGLLPFFTALILVAYQSLDQAVEFAGHKPLTTRALNRATRRAKRKGGQ